MKKTIEQIVDENPDLTPEEHTKIWQQENESPAEAAQAQYPAQLKTPQMNESDLASDVPPEQDRVSKLFGDRAKRETTLEGQIEGEEDAVRKTRQDSGTEKGLYAAGEIASGMLGNILNYDASPQVKGFQKAGKFVDERSDENRQRREFLKERLYRADNPTKQAMEQLQMRGADRKERLDSTLEPELLQNKQTGLREDTAKNMLGQTKIGVESDMYETESVAGLNARKIDEQQLKRVANSGGTNSETAKVLLEAFNEPEGLGTLPPAQRKQLIQDIIKAEKEGGKYSFKDFSAGNDTGYGVFNEATGKFEKLDEGYKTPGVGKGGGLQDDKDLKELAKRLEDKNAVANAFGEVKKLLKVTDLKDKSLSKRDLPGVNIPGVGRISAYSPDARRLDAAILSITGPLSNARYGASQTNTELRKLATELAEGKFNTEPEKIDALARLEELNEIAIAEDKAGFKPEVVNTYETRQTQERAKVPGSDSPKKSWRDLVGGK